MHKSALKNIAHTFHRTLNTAHCKLYTTHCTRCSANYTLKIAHYKLNTTTALLQHWRQNTQPPAISFPHAKSSSAQNRKQSVFGHDILLFPSRPFDPLVLSLLITIMISWILSAATKYFMYFSLFYCFLRRWLKAIWTITSIMIFHNLFSFLS